MREFDVVVGIFKELFFVSRFFFFAFFPSFLHNSRADSSRERGAELFFFLLFLGVKYISKT